MVRILIVVDIQVDFCFGGWFVVEGGDQIIVLINQMMQDFDNVVLMQDWYFVDYFSFVENYFGVVLFLMMQMSYGLQVLWFMYCVIGLFGVQFYFDLDISYVVIIICKGFCLQIDSYLIFFENDYKMFIGLVGYLCECYLEDLYFVGLVYDFCVIWLVVDVVWLGFSVLVIESVMCVIDLNGLCDVVCSSMIEVGVQLI